MVRLHKFCKWQTACSNFLWWNTLVHALHSRRWMFQKKIILPSSVGTSHYSYKSIHLSLDCCHSYLNLRTWTWKIHLGCHTMYNETKKSPTFETPKLWNALQEVWCVLPTVRFQKLIDSYMLHHISSIHTCCIVFLQFFLAWWEWAYQVLNCCTSLILDRLSTIACL